MMKYNYLGDTGLVVSALCFGTMTFGGEGMWEAVGKQPQKEADELIRKSLDSGINFFDTANVYSYGQSETILGNSLKNLKVNRNEAIIATKVRGMMGEDHNNKGLSRFHIFNSVDKSLERLQLDHIDILYVHGVDSYTSIKEIMRCLNDLIESGKVRYLGVCNWPAWMVMKAQGIARQEGWNEFKAMQYFYSLSGRDAEDSLIPLSRSEGLGFMPWSPLAGGFLTGKYTRYKKHSGENARRDDLDFPPINKEQGYEIVDVLKEIADSHEATIAEVALAWVRMKSGVTSTIIGAKNLKQLESNINSVDLILSDDDLDKLNKVSDTPTPYPSWMVGLQDSDRTKPNERDL
ncbi:aldo/keto reductase [Balneola sp. MJW-20]|uniref:aldo/keto reductase n=1 Tax=Gracilimonas aurantiaca TaxID=3234185 RepID=UPI00346621BA